jgi:hypothetical protein
VEGATLFQASPAVEPLFDAIHQAGVFTSPTLFRFATLVIGLMVSMGRRTVSHSLVAIKPLLEGHWSNYHRLYSFSKFSMWRLAAVMVRQVVGLLPSDGVIELVADDTVDGKDGDHVWAKSAHRDPTRSTRCKPQLKYGHKWLVMCVLVHLKGWDRPWALPILCGMCFSPRAACRIGRRPKTPSQVARQLLIRLMRWLPDRKFVLIGDYQVVTHETVAFAQRHARRVTVIGRLRGDANFYAQPEHRNSPSHTGRIKKGKKTLPPARRATQLPVFEQEVHWYGNSRRLVRHVTEQTLWYSRHDNVVAPIRWACVLGDPQQGRADAFFFCSDPTVSAPWIIEAYARRWNIEVLFEESRALLGLETTRHWCRQSVLRVTPILLGLFSAVVLIWTQLPQARRQVVATATPCYTKRNITFADVLAAVRREIWERQLLRRRQNQRCLSLLPSSVRQAILWHLSAAA